MPQFGASKASFAIVMFIVQAIGFFHYKFAQIFASKARAYPHEALLS